MADSTETRKERRATARAERERAAEAQARRRQRLWILGGAIALAAVVVAIVALSQGKDDKKASTTAGGTLPAQVESNARFADLPQSGIVVGDPRAPVTLVEFADLQCPFCRDYTVNVMPTLVDRYVRDGKLRMEFRNVSFIGNDSLRAAQMAAAAGMQDKMWQFAEIFYNNQGEENSGYVTDAFLEKIGHAVRGLNVQRALADRDLPSIQRQLTEAQTQWQTAGFRGTPSFLLGATGGRMSAVLRQGEGPSVANMSAAIDQALAQAR